jgi:hypothetical protein
MLLDPMGLIGEAYDACRVQSAPPPPISLMLVPLRRAGRCSRCERVGRLTLLLGLDEVALCNDCGPFDNAVEVLGTFAELSD